MTGQERRPRLGFLGVGWIGRQRLDALVASGAAEAVAVADADADVASAAARAVGARVVAPGVMLTAGCRGPKARGREELALDGVVIATPSGLHAGQAVTAFEHGLAVFCQKPLATSAPECDRVLAAARRSDRLLGVDMSYRHLVAVREVRQRLSAGAIGHVYAADLVFHNAYGPARSWGRDPGLAGGGCVMDLGVHLIDMALWALAPAKVGAVTARLFAGGAPIGPLSLPRPGPGEDAPPRPLEDYAVARMELASGAVVTLSCSWYAHLGRDAEISAVFRGQRGALEVTNVDGSFYDFASAHNTGPAREVLAGPPDEWGGRALVSWARRLAAGEGFDAGEADELAEVSRVLDMVYSSSCW